MTDLLHRSATTWRELMARGFLRGSLPFFLLLAFFTSLPAHGQNAAVTVDPPSLTAYSSGDTVFITGSGWDPSDTVQLKITETPPHVADAPVFDELNAVVSSTGDIDAEYIIPGHGSPQTFTLTATQDSSSATAQTVFTNDNDPAPFTWNTSSWTLPTTLPFVVTDKGDYVPGQMVQIFGAGWTPGEIVILEIAEIGPQNFHPAEQLHAVAGTDGTVSGTISTGYVIQDHDLGQQFTLTATGLTSGLTAQTTFTDASISLTSITPNSGPAAGGTLVTILGSGSNEFPSGQAPFTVTFATTTVPGTRVDGSHITAITPAHAAGVVNVVVTDRNATTGTLTNGFTYGKTNTTTTVSSSQNPSVFGQSVTFTATVTPTSGSGTPTGTVTFKDGATTLGTGTLASGKATFSTSALTVGSHSITAVYAGDSNFNTSTSSGVTQTVNQAASTTTVTCPANVTYTGAAQTPCTATVTGAGGLNQSLTVTYTNNTNAGTATASASFAGDTNHTNSSDSKNFTINQAASTTVGSCPATVSYTGAAQTPCTATVTGAGGLNQSLTVTYSNNTNAGTATASASFAGDTNHTNSSDSKDFTIDQVASTTVESCPANVSYTGAAQTPCTATVTGVGGLNQSLTVTYSNNTNAGTATASASFGGDANHAGSNDSKNFTINQATSTTTATCPANVTYTGAAQTPCTATVTGVGGLNQSLTVTYSNNTNAGTATASASFAGGTNHTGSSDSKDFTIDKAVLEFSNLSEPTITYGDTPTVISGTIKAGTLIPPGEVTILVNGVTKITPIHQVSSPPDVNEGDFSESFDTDLLDAGEYAITYEYAGSNNFEQVKDETKKLTVNKATLQVKANDKTITFGDPELAFDFTYIPALAVGQTIDTAPTCTVSGAHTDAGTYSITCSGGTDNNYTFTYVVGTLTVNKALSTTVVSCPANDTYTGAAQTPCTATVTGVGGLNQSVTVTYSNNTNAGTATASANFAGDANHESSSDSKNFTIDKASSTTEVSCPAHITYTGSPLTPCSTTVMGVGGLNLTPTPTYSNNMNVGTASVSYTFDGDDNHIGSSDSKTFTIDKASSTTVVSCPAHMTYTGSPLTPCSTTVMGVGGLNLTPTPTYSNDMNVGTASASYTFDGDDNHTGSSDSKTFTIDKAASTTVGSCPANVSYTGAAQTPCTATVTGAGGLNQSLTVTYSNNTNAGTASASASYAGDTNHASSSDSKTFTIAKAASTTTVTCPASIIFTGSPLTQCSATVTGVGGLNQPLTMFYLNNTNVGTASASATYAGDANHNGSSDSKTFQIAAWTLKGFYQPTDMGNVLNTVKSGSTVPLKWEVFAGSTELTSTSMIVSVKAGEFVCTASPEDAIEETITTTGGTVLRYDSTSGQFIDNWATPKGAAGKCYKVTMTTQDSSTLVAFFKLK